MPIGEPIDRMFSYFLSTHGVRGEDMGRTVAGDLRDVPQAVLLATLPPRHGRPDGRQDCPRDHQPPAPGELALPQRPAGMAGTRHQGRGGNRKPRGSTPNDANVARENGR
jgi:hypothetical protein